MKIIFSGGGTGGPTTPLLAISEELLGQHISQAQEFLWLGTRFGPEKNLVTNAGIQFVPIFSGKWRRYLSFKNIIDPIFIFLGFFQSLYYIFKFKPQAVVSAGGFMSVPVILAAWFLQKKTLIHQQDIRKGLANALMEPFASKITVSFEKSLAEFPARKTVWTGNAVRESLFAGGRERARAFFHLEKDIPVVLFTGGGTGAYDLNVIIAQAVQDLVAFCQVIHLTGSKKQSDALAVARYHQYEFLGQEMKDALAISDLVVSRAGLSTLSELSTLAKPAIIIPLPGTHQEENAQFFQQHNAILTARQEDLSPEGLVKAVQEVFCDKVLRESLSLNIASVMKPNGRENIVKEIVELIKNNQ